MNPLLILKMLIFAPFRRSTRLVFPVMACVLLLVVQLSAGLCSECVIIYLDHKLAITLAYAVII